MAQHMGSIFWLTKRVILLVCCDGVSCNKGKDGMSRVPVFVS